MARKRARTADSNQPSLTADCLLAARITLAQRQKDWTTPPQGLENGIRQLNQLLESLVFAGDNCSTLVVGRRGSGKSHMLSHVLCKLQQRLIGASPPTDSLNVDACISTAGGQTQTKALSDASGAAAAPGIHVVYIDGRVVADDMAAMQEISRQLSTDASDSLLGAMTLLAAGPTAHASLSPPAGLAAAHASVDQLHTVSSAAKVVQMLSGKALGAAANVSLRGTHITSAGSGGHVTYEKHMAFVADALRSARARGSTVLLVLDEFDAFARQSKQTLLYHLLDLTQSQDARFGLVGLTSRLDVVDLLEKRLRSRFSHNQILLTHPSWNTCKQVFRDALLLPDSTKASRSSATESPLPTLQEQSGSWNTAVHAMVEDGGVPAFSAVLDALRFRWEAGYSAGALLRCLEAVMLQAFAVATTQSAPLEALSPGLVGDALALVDGDFREALLCGLSQTELCLVIAMAHLEQRGETGYNFDAAWRQYKRFLKGDLSHSLAIPHPVALKSFHHLVELDLVRFAPGTAAARAASGTSGSSGASAAADLAVAQQYNAARLQIDAGKALSSVTSGAVPAPAGVRQWASAGSAETGGE